MKIFARFESSHGYGKREQVVLNIGFSLVIRLGGKGIPFGVIGESLQE